MISLSCSNFDASEFMLSDPMTTLFTFLTLISLKTSYALLIPDSDSDETDSLFKVSLADSFNLVPALEVIISFMAPMVYPASKRTSHILLRHAVILIDKRLYII